MSRHRMRKPLLALAIVLAGCSNSKTATKTTEAATTSTPVASSVAAIEVDAAAAFVDAAPPPEVLAGADFAQQAKTLFRIAACGNDSSPVPDGFEAAVIDAHCKEMASMIAEYKKSWIDVAMPFIAKLRSRGQRRRPSSIRSAAAIFSARSRRIRTARISRPSRSKSPPTFARSTTFRKIASNRSSRVIGSFSASSSKKPTRAQTTSTSAARAFCPARSSSTSSRWSFTASSPRALRLFRDQNDDGSLHYFEQNEIDAADAAVKAGRKTRAETDDAFFSNMEVRFKKAGDTSGATRTLRHVAFNLDDDHMKANPRLEKFLDARGAKISAMTKAASRLCGPTRFRSFEIISRRTPTG